MPAMVGGVIEKNGKFLLVQEAKENCKGKWNLPAGHLEINETVFDNAKREIFEETGCNVELTGLLQISHRVFEDKIFVGFMFSAKIIDENINGAVEKAVIASNAYCVNFQKDHFVSPATLLIFSYSILLINNYIIIK